MHRGQCNSHAGTKILKFVGFVRFVWFVRFEREGSRANPQNLERTNPTNLTNLTNQRTKRTCQVQTGAPSGARAAYWSGLVHRLSRPSRMSDAQLKTLRPATMRRMARMRRRRSSG